jgi:hypothetical protein
VGGYGEDMDRAGTPHRARPPLPWGAVLYIRAGPHRRDIYYSSKGIFWEVTILGQMYEARSMIGFAFSPIGDVRLSDGGDPLDEHDIATSYALQALDFRKPVHFRESSVQSEAG